MNLDGSGFKEITRYPNNGRDPKFSPDRSKVVFVQQRRDSLTNNDEIFVMDADGTNRTQLTNSFDSSEGDPSYSPDGKQIVFQTRTAHIDHPGAGELGKMSCCGTRYTRLEITGNNPVFSPDGARILFSDDGIVIADPNGAKQKRLPQQGSQPSFSPDGKRIVFVSRRPFPKQHSGEPHLSRPIGITGMDVDGGNALRIVGGFEGYSSPVFAPNGNQIVFSAMHDWTDRDRKTGRRPSYDIYIVNTDGSGLKNLTNTPNIDEQNPDVR